MCGRTSPSVRLNVSLWAAGRDNRLMIEVRALPPDGLSVIAEIDRSEHIDTIFEVQAGELSSRSVDLDVPRWNLDDTGPHSVGGFIGELTPVLDRGGVLLAAYEQDSVAGVAIVEEQFEGDIAWLVFLHVSSGHRRRGVASAMWDEAVNRARSAGARSMYVSATPSGSAVGFYLARGCKVLTAPHPELLAKEPEDIHFLATIP